MVDHREPGGNRPSRRLAPATPATYQAVVIGGSAGGMDALVIALAHLPAGFPLPLIVAHHLHITDGGGFAAHLASRVALPVAEALDKQPVEPGQIIVAPANYHLLVERGGTLALSIDPRVNWARPSIDVLFESAARAWSGGLIGVLLSGANEDGARGLKVIHELGGYCIAQDPATAPSPVMPQRAIELGGAARVLTPEQIGGALRELGGGRAHPAARRQEQQEEELA